MKVYVPRKQAKNYKKLFLKRGMRKTVTFKRHSIGSKKKEQSENIFQTAPFFLT